MRPIDADSLTQHLLDKSFYPAIVSAAINNEPTITPCEWISVYDRLPEENVRVLVWLDETLYDYTHIDTDRLKRNIWVRWGKAVTHWMPLPTPPTEKEDEQ